MEQSTVTFFFHRNEPTEVGICFNKAIIKITIIVNINSMDVVDDDLD